MIFTFTQAVPAANAVLQDGTGLPEGTGTAGLSAVPDANTWVMIGIGLGFMLFRMSARSRHLRRMGGR